MELTRVVLPTPGPPVMTSTLEASARRSASCWLSASVRPVLPSTQGMALLGVDRRPGRRADGEVPQPLGDLPLGPVEAGQEDAALPLERVGDHLAGLELQAERGLDQLRRDLQQALRRGPPAPPRAGRNGPPPSPRPARRRCRPAPGSSPSSRCRAWPRSGRRCGSRCRGCRGPGGRGSRDDRRTASAP